YIWKLEAGVRTGVSSTTLIRLARALGVSSDFLLGLDTTPLSGPAGEEPTNPGRPQVGTCLKCQKGVASERPAGMPMADEEATDVPGPLPMCPHCAIPMQRQADPPSVVCPACRYVREV